MEVHAYRCCEDCKGYSSCKNSGYGCCNYLLYEPLNCSVCLKSECNYHDKPWVNINTANGTMSNFLNSVHYDCPLRKENKDGSNNN